MGAGAGVTVPLSGGRGVIRAGPEVVEAVLSVWRGGRWAEGPRGPPCSMSWSTRWSRCGCRRGAGRGPRTCCRGVGGPRWGRCRCRRGAGRGPLTSCRTTPCLNEARCRYELLYLELRRALIGEARGPLHRGVHLSNKLFLGEKCVREPKGGAKNGGAKIAWSEA